MDTRPNVAAYLERNPGMSFVARSDVLIVGAVLCGHDGRRGYLHHLVIDAKHRKQGIARGLLNASFKELPKYGIVKSNIFVYASNDSGQAF